MSEVREPTAADSADLYRQFLARNGYPHTKAREMAFEYGFRAASERAKADGDAVPVAWQYEYHDFADIWPRHVILNRPDGGAKPPTKHHGSPVRNVTPLYAVPLDLRQAVDALEFYANPEIYKPHPHGPAFDRRDLSSHAKAALAAIQGAKT